MATNRTRVETSLRESQGLQQHCMGGRGFRNQVVTGFWNRGNTEVFATSPRTSGGQSVGQSEWIVPRWASAVMREYRCSRIDMHRPFAAQGKQKCLCYLDLSYFLSDLPKRARANLGSSRVPVMRMGTTEPAPSFLKKGSTNLRKKDFLPVTV